jgi:hypothetical protein
MMDFFGTYLRSSYIILFFYTNEMLRMTELHSFINNTVHIQQLVVQTQLKHDKKKLS